MFSVKTLTLSNFRCYYNDKFNFESGINILYGDNASGKTSIVEGLGYFSILKSFKNCKDDDVKAINSDYFFINGQFSNDSVDDKITISYVNGKKTVKMNNIVLNKVSDYVGYFNLVTFIPEDLSIIKGSPSDRRRFLNINLSQVDKKYFVCLSKYNKLLKMRNEYLKNTLKINETYLDTLTSALIFEGKELILRRKEFVSYINTYLNKYGLLISNEKEQYNVKYLPNSSYDSYEKDMTDSKYADISKKSTCRGPHKDDLLFYINSKETNIYSSQGQIRSEVISLKLGLAEYMKIINNKQIIVLDDVFSEIDFNRQEKLLSLLENKGQIFITTTNIDYINDKILNMSNLIKVGKGATYEHN